MTPEGSGRTFPPPALPLLLAAILSAAHTDIPRTAEVAAAPSTAGADRALLDGVSPERALGTVRELVALGSRMGGTSSGDRAAAYVKRRLQESGLAVEEILDPPRNAHEEPSWEARLLDPEPLALDAWPVGFSPSLPRMEVRILEAPPRGEAADGSWALLTDEIPADAMRKGAASGAKAILSDFPREEGRYLDWAPVTELKERRVAAVSGFTLSLNAGKRIRKWLGEGRAVRARLALDSRVSMGRPRTIVATLEGSRPGWYLICAHGDSDSGGPGADDNASGVASLLEAADTMAKAASKGLLPGSRPSVRFAVWGSEVDSTRAFVQAHAAAMDGLLGVFNYDQTAASTEKDALYFEGNDVPWNGAILRALLSAASDHAGRDGFPLEYTTSPSLGGTDASVFMPREFGGAGLLRGRVPATTVFTAAWGSPLEVKQTPGWQSPAWPEKGTVRLDYSRYYHSSGDRPETTADLHRDNVARCARVVVSAILRLMTGTMDAAGSPAPQGP